jgi:hypothetical protein
MVWGRIACCESEMSDCILCIFCGAKFICYAHISVIIVIMFIGID